MRTAATRRTERGGRHRHLLVHLVVMVRVAVATAASVFIFIPSDIDGRVLRPRHVRG